MTVRQRQRRAHAATQDLAWIREREECLRYWPGELLAECPQFWAREQVPDDLRRGSRYDAILSTTIPHPEIEAERRAAWADLKARRLAWLREHDYR